MPDKLLAQYYWPFRPSWLDIAEIANAAGARMPPRSPCFGRMPPRSAGLRRRLARLAESRVPQDGVPTSEPSKDDSGRGEEGSDRRTISRFAGQSRRPRQTVA